MTQDFAKIRPEPLLEQKPQQAPPAWSMMISGVFIGIALGVFACVLFYLSGRVPPLTATVGADNAQRTLVEAPDREPAAEPETDPDDLEYEFYTELENYEVTVDAVPVTINDDPETPLAIPYRLQSGAFNQQNGALQAAARQQELGIDSAVVPAQQSASGRTLYLVQSGPYRTRGELAEAETTLRRNNIKFMRIAPSR